MLPPDPSTNVIDRGKTFASHPVVPAGLRLGKLIFPLYVPYALAEKAAMTDVSALTVKVQVPVPAQAPDQPEKADPDDAVAVSVTCVPAL